MERLNIMGEQIFLFTRQLKNHKFISKLGPQKCVATLDHLDTIDDSIWTNLDKKYRSIINDDLLGRNSGLTLRIVPKKNVSHSIGSPIFIISEYLELLSQAASITLPELENIIYNIQVEGTFNNDLIIIAYGTSHALTTLEGKRVLQVYESLCTEFNINMLQYQLKQHLYISKLGSKKIVATLDNLGGVNFDIWFKLNAEQKTQQSHHLFGKQSGLTLNIIPKAMVGSRINSPIFVVQEYWTLFLQAANITRQQLISILGAIQTEGTFEHDLIIILYGDIYYRELFPSEPAFTLQLRTDEGKQVLENYKRLCGDFDKKRDKQNMAIIRPLLAKMKLHPNISKLGPKKIVATLNSGDDHKQYSSIYSALNEEQKKKLFQVTINMVEYERKDDKINPIIFYSVEHLNLLSRVSGKTSAELLDLCTVFQLNGTLNHDLVIILFGNPSSLDEPYRPSTTEGIHIFEEYNRLCTNFHKDS